MDEHRALAGRYQKATLLDQVKAYFQPVAASPFNNTNTTLIVDVSKYVPGYDLSILKAGGVRGIIARIGEGVNDTEDPTWAGYVQAAYDNDLACFGYYVIHPELYDNLPGNVAEHLKRIKKFIANKAIQGIFIDCEVILDDRGMAISPSWISDRTRSLIDETKRAFPNLIVGCYTARWVVDATLSNGIRLMENWLHKYPLWWASYVYPVSGGPQIEWSALSGYYPSATPKNLPPDATGQGAAKMSIWQWAGDYFHLPGMYSDAGKVNRAACDLNFYMGPEAAFYEWCGYVSHATKPPDNPPEPPPSGDGDGTDDDQQDGGTISSADAKAICDRLDTIIAQNNTLLKWLPTSATVTIDLKQQ